MKKRGQKTTTICCVVVLRSRRLSFVPFGPWTGGGTSREYGGVDVCAEE